MTERERLLEKLGHPKALADRGVDGEKANAEDRLRYLMEKHGITEDDLEDAASRVYFVRYKTDYERRLLYQLSYKYNGPGHASGCVGTYTGRSRKKVAIDCTPAQYIEIEADYEFYRAAFAEEMELFYEAFLHKNNLFPPPELAGSSGEYDDDFDLVRLGKMQAMMEGIDRRTRNKAITEGKGDNGE